MKRIPNPARKNARADAAREDGRAFAIYFASLSVGVVGWATIMASVMGPL